MERHSKRGRHLGVFCVLGIVIGSVLAIVPTAAQAVPVNRLVFSTPSASQPGLTDIREYDNDGQPPRTLLTVPTSGDGVKPALSPDGHWLAYTSNATLQLYDLIAQAAMPPLGGYSVMSTPAWSHDGSSIAFGAGSYNSAQIYRISVDTSGLVPASLVSLGVHPGVDLMPSWSLDDTQIVFAEINTAASPDRFGQYPQSIFVMSASTGNLQRQLTYNDTTACLDMWPSYLGSGRVVFDRLCANTNTRLIFVVGADGTGEAVYSQPDQTDWNVTVSADGAYVATQCGVPSGGTHLCMIDTATMARVDLTAVYGFNGADISFQTALRSSVPPPLPPPAPDPTPAPAPIPLNYVALGDSYSSGEGNSPYESGTDTRKGSRRNVCHRSMTGAFSKDVSLAGYVLNESNFSCSGAVTSNVDRVAQYYGQDIQLKFLGTDTELVTITIGGNDIGFSDIARKCIAGIDPCDNLDWAISQRTFALKRRLLNRVYPELLAAAPNAKIVVVGYPYIFPDPDVVDTSSCTAIRTVVRTNNYRTITPGELKWLNRKTTELNSAIQSAVEAIGDPRLTYLDVSNAFAGHEICTSESWVYGYTPSVIESTFHPNPSGQSEIARLVSTKAAAVLR